MSEQPTSEPEDPSAIERRAGAFEELFPNRRLATFVFRFVAEADDYVLFLANESGELRLPFWAAEDLPTDVLAQVMLWEILGVDVNFLERFSMNSVEMGDEGYTVTNFIGHGTNLPELPSVGEFQAVWVPLGEVYGLGGGTNYSP